jgi:hypothetical protein
MIHRDMPIETSAAPATSEVHTANHRLPDSHELRPGPLAPDQAQMGLDLGFQAQMPPLLLQ